MAKPNQTKEVATVKTSGALALPEDFDQSFLDMLPEVDAQDFKIPSIQIVQPTSKLPGNQGDLIDSNTKQKLCGAGEKLSLVPLWFFKTYQVFIHDAKGGRKWIRTETAGPANAHYRTERELPMPNGEKEVRQEITNIFCLLEKDLSSDMPQIYVFRFKGKSSPEAKKLLTFWTMTKGAKKIPYSFLFEVTPELVTDDKGKYVVAKVSNKIIDKNYAQISGDQLRVAHDAVKMIVANQQAMTAKTVATTDEDESIEALAKSFAPDTLNV